MRSNYIFGMRRKFNGNSIENKNSDFIIWKLRILTLCPIDTLDSQAAWIIIVIEEAVGCAYYIMTFLVHIANRQYSGAQPSPAQLEEVIGLSSVTVWTEAF